MDRFRRWIAEHLRLELDVLRGERCRICYAPVRDCESGLCGCARCHEEAGLLEENHHLDLPA